MEFIFYDEPLMDITDNKLNALGMLADGGDMFAQCLLGDLFENGNATQQAVACQWYLNAAQNGCRFSQYKIGTMYLNGCGLRQNNNKALLWFMKARYEYLGCCCLPECFTHVYLDSVRIRSQEDNAGLKCVLSMMSERGQEIKQQYNWGGHSYCSASTYYGLIHNIAA